MKLEILLLLSTLYALTASDYAEDRKQWHKFMRKFNKTYDYSKKDNESFTKFRDNLKFMIDHNKNTNSTFKMAVYSFADTVGTDECHESKQR